MKSPFNKQTQFELFPDTASKTPREESPQIFGQAFYFSLENLIVGGIIFLIVVVVAFSFGIESGRRAKMAARQDRNLLLMSADASSETDPSGVSAFVSGEDVVRSAEAAVTGVLPETVSQTDARSLVQAGVVAEAEKSIDKTASLETIHTVQVASFKQIARAEREASDLKKMGYDAFTAPKGSYYIVCVGRFSDRQQANALLKPLRKKYSDCYVRRL